MEITLNELKTSNSYLYNYVKNALSSLTLNSDRDFIKINQYFRVGKIGSESDYIRHFGEVEKRIVYFGEFSKNGNCDVVYLSEKSRVSGDRVYNGFFNEIEFPSHTSFSFIGYRIEFPKYSDMGLLA